MPVDNLLNVTFESDATSTVINTEGNLEMKVMSDEIGDNRGDEGVLIGNNI